MQSRSIALEHEQDIVVARNEVRQLARALGFSLTDQTRLATVASELARNVVKYAGRGRLIAQPITDNDGRTGLRLVFEDTGPGIRDLAAAMRDALLGYLDRPELIRRHGREAYRLFKSRDFDEDVVAARFQEMLGF